MLANVSSAKIMYNKFIAKSKKSHSCPLCIKKFEDQEEEKFIERVNYYVFLYIYIYFLFFVYLKLYTYTYIYICILIIFFFNYYLF